ncbi:MAG: four helix bundle protein [Bacteroidales bacterium]|nr:four helix bundle protein [Bacteroidales bacterium]
MITFFFFFLEVRQRSRELGSTIYSIQSTFPATEKFGLGDQLRRAVISVPSNIAEGNARRAVKEQIHFIDISYGSLMEVYCQLLLAFDLHYIDEQQLNDCKIQILSISKMLKGLRYQKQNLLPKP